MYKTPGRAFRAAAMLACLLGSACSGGDGSDDPPEVTDPIVGKWGLELSNGCVVGFTAQADDLYEADVICLLEGGDFGVEAEVGTYFTAGSQLAMTPTHATCATSDHSADTIFFNVDRDTLTLIFPDGALIMERIPDSPGGTAVLRYGCMDADAGLFTQGELRPL
jgi:hypothetical protein